LGRFGIISSLIVGRGNRDPSCSDFTLAPATNRRRKKRPRVWRNFGVEGRSVSWARRCFPRYGYARFAGMMWASDGRARPCGATTRQPERAVTAARKSPEPAIAFRSCVLTSFASSRHANGSFRQGALVDLEFCNGWRSLDAQAQSPNEPGLERLHSRSRRSSVPIRLKEA